MPSKDDHEFDLLSDSHCDDSVSGCSEYQLATDTVQNKSLLDDEHEP